MKKLVKTIWELGEERREEEKKKKNIPCSVNRKDRRGMKPVEYVEGNLYTVKICRWNLAGVAQLVEGCLV